jgi:hypothetical protein
VALLAAYAIALASLLTSFGTARMAAEAAALPGTPVLCHSEAGSTAPTQQDDGGIVCADCCCIGCLMLMAALPPPPADAIGVIRASTCISSPLAHARLSGGTPTKSHRSRAPPLAA